METSAEQKSRRIDEAFDKLRSSGKTDPEIFAALYEDLRRLAHRRFEGKNAQVSLRATELVNEIALVVYSKALEWEDGEEFFVFIARKMLDIRINHYRKKHAEIRDAGKNTSLELLRQQGFEPSTVDSSNDPFVNFTAERVRASLDWLRLRYRDLEKAAVLKYLSADDELSDKEVAVLLGCSREKVSKDMRKARALLGEYLDQH